MTTSFLFSQEERSYDFIGFGFSYGLDFPAGDMADRFGQNFHASISLELYKNKFNGMFGLEAALLFGDNVKEDVISNLRNDNNSILGANGAYADVFLRQRGTYLGIYANKILLGRKTNSHSGLALGLGLGLLQHKVRIQVDTNNAPQLSGNYAKGYDRNSLGPALKQKLNYLHIGKNKSLNFEFSMYVMEAFTKNTRSINFDTEMKETGTRLDILIGMDIKWIIPFKDKQDAGEIFY